METILYILGMLYILSFAITLAFGIEQCIEAKLEWHYYVLTILLAATWPLMGFWLADKVHDETKESANFWRRKYLEVRENEIHEETKTCEE